MRANLLAVFAIAALLLPHGDAAPVRRVGALPLQRRGPRLRVLGAATAVSPGAVHSNSDGNPQTLVPRTTQRRLRPRWPCGDDLDRSILKLTLPAALNLAIFPLAGAVDVFWVSRLGDAQMLAGMGAANQVFSTLFWLIAFLPSVTTPVVADAVGRGDRDLAQRRVSEALFLGVALGLLGFSLVQLFPAVLLRSVAPPSSQIFDAAGPYLSCRGVSFAPALFSAVAFAAFRAEMDPVTPLVVSLVSSAVNCLLDPVLIFWAGLGVAGAGLATSISEVVSCALFAFLLFRRRMVRAPLLLRPPPWGAVWKLLTSGAAVQLRSMSLQAAFLFVARTVTRMDTSGVSAAAHQITQQFWQLGGIALLAVSSAASVLIPSLRAQPRSRGGGAEAAACAADRVLTWGGILGSVLGGLLLGILPFISRLSPLPEVQRAARPLAVFAALLQPLVGVVFAAEGIMQGLNCFAAIAVVSALGSAGMIVSLRALLPLGLSGVWLSFFVFNLVRLTGALWHVLCKGPLALAPRAVPEGVELDLEDTTVADSGASPVSDPRTA